MPRRSNNNTMEFDIESISLPHKCNLVGTKLKTDYLDMSKKLNIEHECIICMEKICCSECFSVSECGNTLHLSCWIRCRGKCPMCRN